MSQKIRCVILEDEPTQLKLLKMYCEDHLGHLCKVVDSYTSSEAFINNEKNLNYELLFLDIDMDGLKGTDVARLVKKPIIFVTARKEYDDEVLDIQFKQDNIIALVRKPIDASKVETALNKLLKNKPKPESKVFNTSVGDVKINFNEILLITTKIDGIKKNILDKCLKGDKFHARNKILFTNNDIFLINNTDFEDLLSILPDDIFFKINKSSIVSRNSIAKDTSEGLSFNEPLNSYISSVYFSVSSDSTSEFKKWFRK